MIMGLLDSLIGAVSGGMGGQGGAGDAGGTQGALLNAVIGMLANGQGQGGGAGGLGDLIGKFTQNGMGDVISSWVGHGQNAPISGDQLSSVLGADTIGNIAAKLGMSHGDVAGQLSQVLPQMIDRLTPHGQAPAGGLGGISDILAQLTQAR
jgi:uncharacterized protein YidB (DUF937 family)